MSSSDYNYPRHSPSSSFTQFSPPLAQRSPPSADNTPDDSENSSPVFFDIARAQHILVQKSAIKQPLNSTVGSKFVLVDTTSNKPCGKRAFYVPFEGPMRELFPDGATRFLEYNVDTNVWTTVGVDGYYELKHIDVQLRSQVESFLKDHEIGQPFIKCDMCVSAQLRIVRIA